MVSDKRMHDAYDRVRARVLGLLDPASAAELERELERDPELRRFAEDWPEVHALTRPARDEAPASGLDFASLRHAILRDAASSRPTGGWRTLIRRAAAAAVLATAAGALAWWTLEAWREERSHAPNEPLRLVAIDLAESSDSRSRPAVPERLASYRPVVAGEIQWIPSLEEGLEIAALVERPVLLFGMLPTCPWCIHMQANGLRDEGVLALLEDYVPVRIDYSRLDEFALAEVFEGGYPRFEVYAPGGERALSFSGFHEAPVFVAELTEGIEILPWRERPRWDDVQRLAAELARGREAAGERRFGEAQRIFAQLSREGVPGALPRAASEELAWIGAVAADTLRHAFSLPAGAARESLEAAAAQFAGTPYERDFAAALERVRVDGELPHLAAAPARSE